jgi:hypothetical protein
MIGIRCFFVNLFSLLIPINVFSLSAVTYEDCKIRFGDQLQLYLHAKWFSYLNKIPLLYKPFELSHFFVLDDEEVRWTENIAASFLTRKNYSLNEQVRESVLYSIPYFSECPDENSIEHLFEVDWQSQEFISILRKAFTLKRPRASFDFPTIPNLLTVAMHVRKGSGTDGTNPHRIWPFRFAPDSYYIESLRELNTICPNRPIYVQIFTDDPNPEFFAQSLGQAVSDLPIQIGYEKVIDVDKTHILEDFVSMLDFDCLIRSASNFSFLQSVIGNYQVIISPKHISWRIVKRGEALEDWVVENYIDEKIIIKNLIVTDRDQLAEERF